MLIVTKHSYFSVCVYVHMYMSTHVCIDIMIEQSAISNISSLPV